MPGTRQWSSIRTRHRSDAFRPRQTRSPALRCLHSQTEKRNSTCWTWSNCAPPRFEVPGLCNRLQILITAKVSKISDAPKGCETWNEVTQNSTTSLLKESKLKGSGRRTYLKHGSWQRNCISVLPCGRCGILGSTEPPKILPAASLGLPCAAGMIVFITLNYVSSLLCSPYANHCAKVTQDCVWCPEATNIRKDAARRRTELPS